MDEHLVQQFDSAVDRFARVTYVQSQVMCAQIELQSMMAANVERMAEGKALAYDEAAIVELIEKYNIHHNGVVNETT